MTTTDTDALAERIARALRQATDDGADRTEDYAAAVLPIVEEYARAAAKAAWDEAIAEALDGWTIPANGNIEAVRFILLSINPYMPEETPDEQ